MMMYEETTISKPISDHIIHFLALAGSLPELAAKIYMSPDTISAIVTTVPIKNVADKTISCTNIPTELVSHFLIPNVSLILNLHCPLTSKSSSQVIPITDVCSVFSVFPHVHPFGVQLQTSPFVHGVLQSCSAVVLLFSVSVCVSVVVETQTAYFQSSLHS